MADGNTPTYNLILPEIDGADGTWGISLNSNLGSLDSLLSGGTALSAITVTGTVTAGGVSLGDNEKIQLGNTQDLELFHDGTNSYVQDAGDGGLILNTTSGNGVFIHSATETMGAFHTDGAVNLYYDNAEKFATTATGVDVTGTVTGLNFQHDNNDVTADSWSSFARDGVANALYVQQGATDKEIASFRKGSTQAGQGTAVLNVNSNGISVLGKMTVGSDGTDDLDPDFSFVNTETASDGNTLGQMIFSGKNSNNDTESYAFITGKSTDVTDGEEDGEINLVVKKAGTHTQILHASQAGIDVTGDVKGDSLTIDNSNSLNTAALVNSSTGRSMLNVTSTFEGTVSEQEASIEIGANKLAFIDFKTPDTDDYDLRIYHSEPENLSMVNSLNDNLFLRSGGKVALQHNYGDTKLETTSTGIDVTGSMAATVGIKVGGSNLMSGVSTDLTSVANSTSLATSLAIKTYVDASGGNQTLAQTLVLGNATGGTDIQLTSGDEIVGTGDIITKHDTGNQTVLQSSDGVFRVQATETFSALYFGANASNTAVKLQTTSTGVDVTGTITADGLTLGAGQIATFNSGAGGNLQISGDATGSSSLIKQTGGGDLIIQGQNGSLKNDANDSLIAWDNARAELYWRGATGAGAKLATTETGVDVTGDLDVTGTITSNAFAYSKATVNNAADIAYTAFNSFAGKRIINTASATATTYGLPTPVAADIGKSWIICNPTDSLITIDHDASGTANYIWIMDGVTLSAATSSWTIKKGAVVEIVVAAAAADGGGLQAPNYLIFGAGLLEV